MHNTEYRKVAQRSLLSASATQQHDNILFIKNESKDREYAHELKENYSGTEGKKNTVLKARTNHLS